MRTVMIVDDDMSAQERVRSLLAEYGDFDVVLSAGTLKEGERILSEEAPDILFLDLELPDGSGMDLLERVRKYHLGMYVVVFTAFYQHVNDAAYRHGEDDYLLKPVVRDEFDKVIRRYLASGKEPEEAPTVMPRGKLYDIIGLTTMRNELRPTKCSEIGFFRYHSERKLWTAVLDDTMVLMLRKGTRARDIMALSPLFQQSHQSYIVNLSHVRLVSNTQIRLHSPFNLYSIPMGRTFYTPFVERFRMV